MNTFTPLAQQVLALARTEAARFNHNFVGTEHLLLGIIKLGKGTAVAVLGRLGLNLETVRQEVEKQVGTGPDQALSYSLPYTPRVRKVLALAAEEAKALNHTYLGTEHILLGLLREGDGVAARILKNLDVDLETTRKEVLRELEPSFPATAGSGEPGSMEAGADRPEARTNSIDTRKRYDVYCTEPNQRVVIYRNALFKSRKTLLRQNEHEVFADFLELEQADGKTVYVSWHSVIKFCEPGVTPGQETAPG